MQQPDFDEVLAQILAKDPRYHREAYLFVRDGLPYAQKMIAKTSKSEPRNISGQELLNALKSYGLNQYGPLTLTVLNEWGVQRCEDFGEIVFNMVDHGLLMKTERDSRDDYKGGYTFDEAFRQPFVPKPKKSVEAPQPMRPAEPKPDPRGG